LGRGSFGSVALVTSSVTNERAAMKTIDRAKLFTAALKKTVEQEVRILKKLRHDGIVKLFEVIETPRAIHMVMEYSPGGNMQQLVRALKRIGEERARPLFAQMVEAVDYCHSQRVCHRDLKLENFVLDRTQQRVQLIDFGLSVIWRPEQPLYKSYGTPCYTAPEIMSGQSYQGPQVDVWSLGVSLTTMLTGALPFQAGSAPELKRRVMAGKYLISDSVSELGRELVRSMLTLVPEQRAELREIREGRWLFGVATRLPPPLAARHTDPAAGAPLDAATLRQLESLGMAAETVEASVRAELYNHDAACYGLLLSARRGSSSTSWVPGAAVVLLRNESYLPFSFSIYSLPLSLLADGRVADVRGRTRLY
jgi:serine/threonine protein kinase